MPGTAYAGPAVAAPYWTAASHQCGDTIQVAITRAVYLSWRHLNEVIPRIRGHFGYGTPPVRWRIGSGDRSFFSRRHNEIVLSPKSTKWVAAHEYGHALHCVSLGGMWTTTRCNPHYLWVPSSYTCAFSEGLANYAASIGAPGVFDFENAEETTRRAETEGSVAALFQDLIDTNNETGDSTTYPSTYVIEVFRTCTIHPPDSRRRAGSRTRNTVPSAQTSLPTGIPITSDQLGSIMSADSKRSARLIRMYARFAGMALVLASSACDDEGDVFPWRLRVIPTNEVYSGPSVHPDSVVSWNGLLSDSAGLAGMQIRIDRHVLDAQDFLDADDHILSLDVGGRGLLSISARLFHQGDVVAARRGVLYAEFRISSVSLRHSWSPVR